MAGSFKAGVTVFDMYLPTDRLFNRWSQLVGVDELFDGERDVRVGLGSRHLLLQFGKPVVGQKCAHLVRLGPVGVA